MKTEIRNDSELGRVLWMTDGQTELAVTLDVGIRVIHLSCAGMQNLLYRQPADCSDGLQTPDGWRIFGGHRFWAAPESEKSYYPDQQPLEYALAGDGVILCQPIDPWTGLQKTLTLHFCPDGSIRAEHRLTNCSDHPVEAAAWGVTTMAGGGTAQIPFAGRVTETEQYNPERVVSLWGTTSLGDERICFTKDGISATHLPSDDYFKIGLYSFAGKMTMQNFEQEFELSIKPLPMEDCADLGCNLELYMNRHVMELESLGKRTLMQLGQSAEHTEIWRVRKLS